MFAKGYKIQYEQIQRFSTTLDPFIALLCADALNPESNVWSNITQALHDHDGRLQLPKFYNFFSSLYVDNTGENAQTCCVQIEYSQNILISRIIVPANYCGVYEIANRPMSYLPWHQFYITVDVVPLQVKVRNSVVTVEFNRWLQQNGPQQCCIFSPPKRLTWKDGVIIDDVDIITPCRSLQNVQEVTQTGMVYYYQWMSLEELESLRDDALPDVVSSIFVTNLASRNVHLKFVEPQLQHHWYDIPPGHHVIELFWSEVYQPTRHMLQFRTTLPVAAPLLHIRVRVGWIARPHKGHKYHAHTIYISSNHMIEYNLAQHTHRHLRQCRDVEELIVCLWFLSVCPSFQTHCFAKPELETLISSYV